MSHVFAFTYVKVSILMLYQDIYHAPKKFTVNLRNNAIHFPNESRWKINTAFTNPHL